MLEPYDVVSAEELERVRADLLLEAMDEVGERARRYVQEPGEAAWHDLVGALARAYGDSATYDLLRAVEIHSRTSDLRR